MGDSKARQLRTLIESPGCSFILEAHNGLSAKIVEEAGFLGIWGSGLSLSAAMGVRDNNEASWTQVLEVVEFMCDNTEIPILLDGDTGFGDFNNVRRLIRKLEQRDVAGVCIEDKLFPKANSFFFGEHQPLADIEEFCGKVRAGKDSQTNPDFCLVARVEALVTGWGLAEALKRAYAYSEAGADAILMHSKSDRPDEVLGFLNAWDDQKPIVIVPTTYGVVPSKVFEDAGAGLIVWANHMLRSSITAMQAAAARIESEKSIIAIGADIIPVKEIFRLQNMQELREAEKIYRPKGVNTTAIILAASRGQALGELTVDRPKCMVEIGGKSLLETLVSRLNEQGIKEIQVVVGYEPDTIDLPNISKIENPDYAEAGVLQSLFTARDLLIGPTVISYGDILFSDEILRDLLASDGDIVLTVDTAWIQGEKQGRLKDIVSCEFPYSNVYLGQRTSPITSISCEHNRKDADGEWIGILKISPEGASALKEDMEAFYEEDPDIFRQASLVDLLSRMVEKGRLLEAHYYAGHWLDVDSVQDLEYAEQLHRTLENLRSRAVSNLA